MGVIFFILLVVLIAQIGFWNTFGAIVGAVAMIVLMTVLITAVLIVGGLMLASRTRERY